MFPAVLRIHDILGLIRIRIRIRGSMPLTQTMPVWVDDLETVFRIHAILEWIRIRESMPLTNGSGFRSGSWIRILLFLSLTLQDASKKLIF
jgi:hypothetical protein